MKLFKHTLAACTLTVAFAAPLWAADSDDAPAKKSDSEKSAAPKLGTTGYMDSLDGFRGVKFGTDFSQFTGLTVEKDYDKFKTYTKAGDNLTIGLCHLQGIVYHFYDGKFYGVSLHTEGHEDSSTLLAIVTAAFGKAEPGENEDTFFWDGKKDWAHFATHPETKQGHFFFGNLGIAHDLGAYEKKAAEDAASQL